MSGSRVCVTVKPLPETPPALHAGDSAALRAPLKVDRDVAADPYLKGISTGDFSDTLTALLGKDAPGLSATQQQPSAA